MDDACHRHVIWSWNRGDAQYHSVQEETRCLYQESTYNEADAQAIYESNIMKARGLMVHQTYGGATHTEWPGGAYESADKYLVAILRWNPPMSNWDWQQWQYVVPDMKAAIVMSAKDQAGATEAETKIFDQISNLPTPDLQKGSGVNVGVAVAVAGVVGGLLAAGWTLLKFLGGGR